MSLSGKLKSKSSVFAVAALVLFALSDYAQAAIILIDNNFDGIANDTGPAFQSISNGVGTGGGGNTTTGVITTGDNSNSTRGLNNTSLVAVPGGTTSLTATFVVASAPASVSTLSANGLFFGIVSGPGSTATDGTALYNNNPRAFGYVPGASSIADHSVIQDLNQSTSSVVFSLPTVPTNASFADGFTVAVTINSDNTWSILTTGLSTNATGTGSYAGSLNTGVSGFDFATFITGGVGLNSSLQSNALSVDIDQATLVAVVIPEPSMLVMTGLGIISMTAYRRRRSSP